MVNARAIEWFSRSTLLQPARPRPGAERRHAIAGIN